MNNKNGKYLHCFTHSISSWINMISIVRYYFSILYLWCRRIVIVNTLILFQGCAWWAPQHHLTAGDIRALPYSSGPDSRARIDGMHQALNRSPNTPLRVLVVHGMGAQELGYSNDMQEKIGEGLGLTKVEMTSQPIDVVRGYEPMIIAGQQPFDKAINIMTSKMTRTAWQDANQRIRVVFYELLWAPLRNEVKSQFLACFESRSVNQNNCRKFSSARRNTDSRKALNSYIKDNVMVNGFADAMLVLSPLGNVLRDDIDLSMCMIVNDILSENHDLRSWKPGARCNLASLGSTGDSLAAVRRDLEKTEFFAITHSLGSFFLMDMQKRIVFDQTQHLENSALKELTFSLIDDATVFMFANQISLLELARLKGICVSSSADCHPDGFSTLDDFVESQPMTSQMTQYVAFNDVDDILGFELPPYLSDVGLYGTLVNVSVRNPAWRFPFAKGPLGTHTGYYENPAVIEAILDGFPLH